MAGESAGKARKCMGFSEFHGCPPQHDNRIIVGFL
jgi:hypothetical protein